MNYLLLQITFQKSPDKVEADHPKKKTFYVKSQSKQSLQSDTNEHIKKIEDQVTTASKQNISFEKTNCSTSTRPTREAKTTCNNRIVGIMCDLDDSYSQETNDRKKKSLKNESTVEYNNRLDRMRLQANKRRAKESDDQRSQRLEDSRNRVTLCRIQESAEQRRKRLEDSRLQSNLHRTQELEEQKNQHLRNMRQQTSKNRAEETFEQRERRL